jgi:hypothetical protein
MLYNWIEQVGMSKGTRITVDLGSEELLKAVKFASAGRTNQFEKSLSRCWSSGWGARKARGNRTTWRYESSECIPRHRWEGELTELRNDAVCAIEVAGAVML